MRRAIVVLGVVVAAALLGRLSAPDPAPEPPALGVPAGHTSRGAAGAQGAGERTRSGAVAAALAYQRSFADVAILQPGELQRRIEEAATPAFAGQMLTATRPGTRRLSAGPLGQGLRVGVRTAYFAVPVSYRVRSYSSRRAVIENWGFTLLGNATAAEPTAYFGRARITLAWSGDRWRIAHSRAAFGPTPKLAVPRGGGEGFELLDLIAGMRSYALAP